jgi:NAD-specific glutamate dehydrogenase
MNDFTDRDFGRLEGKVDGLVTQVTALTERLDAKLTDTDKRISTVEKKQYWMTGIAMGLAFVLAKVDFTQLFSVSSAAKKVAGL